MDEQRLTRLKTSICDRLEQMDPQELAKPSMAEYYRNLASLHCKLCQIAEAEQGEYSMRGSYRGGSYRDGIEWGAYDDGSYRRGRAANGRYVSMRSSPRDQLQELMQEPTLTREEKEALRRAMESMR